MLYQSLVYIHTYGEITLSNPYLRVAVLVTLQITGVLPYLVVWEKFSQNRLEKYLDTNPIICKEQMASKRIKNK
jgi:hypothetical protein